MDVFRFAKLPQRANDPVRRYQILHGRGRDHVGDIEVTGGGPAGDAVVLAVVCHATLSDAAREDALNTARGFLRELATGWGVQLSAPTDDGGWREEPDGTFRIRLVYQAF